MTNGTFEDLERRCKAINRKIFFKWFLLLLIIIFPASILTYKSYFSIDNPDYVKKIKKVKAAILFDKSVAKKPVPVVVLKEKVDVNKTVAVKDTNSTPKKPEVYQTILLKSNIVIPKANSTKYKRKTALMSKIKVPKLEKIKKLEEPQKIKIFVKTMQDEQSLLEVYGKGKNFDSSLELSLYYFKKKKYEKAILYSKEANHYNPSSSKPWLIYAKSKVKQNKKEDAIKALETYLSYFSSSEAKTLLAATKESK